jgi:hypothetical protein
MKRPKQRFHVNRNPGSFTRGPGRYDFEVGDRRDGQIVALCWSRRMANRIRSLLNHDDAKGKEPS